MRYHGGVVIYIHESCPFQKIDIQSNYQVVAAKVTIRRRTTATIASMCIPFSKNREEVSQIRNNLPKPCMLLGNFNAHYQMWREQRSTSRVREMERITNINNLNILNNRQSTHVSGSAIDPSYYLKLQQTVYGKYIPQCYSMTIISS